MEGKKQIIKSTKAQRRKLTDYMSINRAFANGEFSGPLGSRTMEEQWAALRDFLNELGPDKSVGQWKQTWRDMRRKARHQNAKASTSHEFTGNPGEPVPVVTETTKMILDTIGHECSTGTGPSESGVGRSIPIRIPAAEALPSTPEAQEDIDENGEPKSKKLRQDNFSIVTKCCINLVKKHGRLVTMFDDRAFRDLINLIPMTESERQIINSENIQKLLEHDNELGDDADIEVRTETMADDAVDDDEDEIPLQRMKIKSEVIEALPCTCGKNTDETMTRHAVECPASSQQTYYNFFEVSLDSATCQICYKTLSWTNISSLKEHLQNNHPSVDFIDDDDKFQKGPISEDESTNNFGMEEVFLEENLSDSEDVAKRRRKKAKAPLNITGPISRENIAASLDRFKSLDCFGQYVASLMKLIPKDKCIKFQIQFVEQLLQEQAAAG